MAINKLTRPPIEDFPPFSSGTGQVNSWTTPWIRWLNSVFTSTNLFLTPATPVRSLGTIYQNAGNLPIYVSVVSNPGTAANRWLRGFIGQANPPTILVAGGFTATDNDTTITFAVPPGYFYGVQWQTSPSPSWVPGATTGAITSWVEIG